MFLIKGSRFVLLFLVACALLSSTCERRIDVHPVALQSITEVQIESNYELSVTIGEALQTQINKPTSEFNLLARSTHADVYDYLEERLNTAVFTNPLAVENRNNFEWSVDVIVDDARANAFTFPGGHLYITTGLLQFLESENQLLTLYSHEIAYADRYYAALALLDEFGGTSIGDIDLNKADESDISIMVETISAWTYEESIVLDADQFSIDVLCPFNYDSGGMMDIIDKTEQDGIELAWMNYKHADLETRRAQIETLTFDCGFNGVTNTEAYYDFLSLLP